MDGENPDLGALAVNAPGTTATMALGAGSPAADRVANGCPPPSTDQRGATRPQGSACDIGAYELAVATPETTTTTSSPAATTTASPSAAAGAGEAGRNRGTLPRTGTGSLLVALGVLLLAMGIGGHLLHRREHRSDASHG